MFYFVMSSTPVISKEVKLKRILKVFVMTSPILRVILVIASYYIDLLCNTLKNHPVEQEQKKVLGVEDSKP